MRSSVTHIDTTVDLNRSEYIAERFSNRSEMALGLFNTMTDCPKRLIWTISPVGWL